MYRAFVQVYKVGLCCAVSFYGFQVCKHGKKSNSTASQCPLIIWRCAKKGNLGNRIAEMEVRSTVVVLEPATTTAHCISMTMKGFERQGRTNLVYSKRTF